LHHQKVILIVRPIGIVINCLEPNIGGLTVYMREKHRSLGQDR